MSDDRWFYAGTGSLHGIQGPEEAPPRPVKAVLWVPDCEQRHGWREYYIRAEKPKADDAPRRPELGFGKPGSRE